MPASNCICYIGIFCIIINCYEITAKSLCFCLRLCPVWPINDRVIATAVNSTHGPNSPLRLKHYANAKTPLIREALSGLKRCSAGVWTPKTSICIAW